MNDVSFNMNYQLTKSNINLGFALEIWEYKLYYVQLLQLHL